VAELAKYAGNPPFAQVLDGSRTSEPPGRNVTGKLTKQGPPRLVLTVGVHAFGLAVTPVSGSGWAVLLQLRHGGNTPNRVQAFTHREVIEGVLFESIPTSNSC